ncbi:MAG: peroxide stress protein YaaA, partial [Desulfotignum sp.]
MLVVISPSKTLDFNGRSHPNHTIPFFKSRISQLIDHMKTLSEKDLETLMNISPKLAGLNHDRYQRFQLPFTPDNSRQALLAFKGDVYQGIQVDDYTDSDIQFAQAHLRILSGLYGLLRPL